MGYTIHSAKVGSDVASDIERIEYLAERMPPGCSLNIEDTGGTALADTGAVHLAQSTPARYRRGTWFCHEMITVDPIIGGSRNHGGTTSAPATPGLGAEPDPVFLADPVAVYE
jgi:hypothetical protein